MCKSNTIPARRFLWWRFGFNRQASGVPPAGVFPRWTLPDGSETLWVRVLLPPWPSPGGLARSHASNKRGFHREEIHAERKGALKFSWPGKRTRNKTRIAQEDSSPGRAKKKRRGRSGRLWVPIQPSLCLHHKYHHSFYLYNCPGEGRRRQPKVSG